MKWDAVTKACICGKSMTGIHKKNIMHMTGAMKNTLKQKTMMRLVFVRTTHLALPVHGLVHWMAKTLCELKHSKIHILYGSTDNKTPLADSGVQVSARVLPQ